MSSPIESLPVELIDFIIAHFSLPDYQKVRLASRKLHHFTLPSFHRRYFTRRTTTFAAPSLDRLLRVSACRHLAENVTSLVFKLLNDEEISLLRDISRVGKYPPPKRFPKITHARPEEISHEVATYDWMRAGGGPKEVIDKLSRAMRRFGNIKSIRLFINERTLGCNPCTGNGESYSDAPEVASSSFKVILAAVVKSEIKIQRLYTVKNTHVRQETASAPIVYTAFSFPFNHLLALGSTFSSLRVLVLALRSFHYEDASGDGLQHCISNFISTAAALEELTLCFQSSSRADVRYNEAAMHFIASSVELPRLKKFCLWGGLVKTVDMIAFTQAHSLSLRRLHIRQCFMLDGLWVTLIDSLRKLNLKYIRLDELKYNLPNGLVVDMVWNRSDDKLLKAKMVLDATKESERTMDEMLTDCINCMLPDSVPP